MVDVNKVSKNFVVLLIARSLQKVAPLILIPVYMNALTPSDFGIYGILILAISSIGAFLNNFGSIPFGKFYVSKQLDSAELITSSIMLLVGLYASIFVVVLLFKTPFANSVGLDTAESGKILLWSIAALFPVIIHSLLDAYCRISARTNILIVVEAVSGVSHILAGYILVAHLGYGLNGAIMALCLGNIVIIGFAVAILIPVAARKPSAAIIASILGFSWPLLPAAVIVMARDSIPRIGGAAFVNLEFSGYVSVATMIAVIPALVVSAYYGSFGSNLLHLFENGEYSSRRIDRQFTEGLVFCSLISFAIGVFSEVVFPVFAPAEYSTAAQLIPWFAFAATARYFWLYRSMLLIHLGRTKLVLATNFFILLIVACTFVTIIFLDALQYVGLASVLGFIGATFIGKWYTRDIESRLPSVSLWLTFGIVITYLLTMGLRPDDLYQSMLFSLLSLATATIFGALAIRRLRRC